MSEVCEQCGSEVKNYRDMGCPKCGAPVCCPVCCEHTEDLEGQR